MIGHFPVNIAQVLAPSTSKSRGRHDGPDLLAEPIDPFDHPSVFPEIVKTDGHDQGPVPKLGDAHELAEEAHVLFVVDPVRPVDGIEPGAVLDAEGEAKRLQENATLGRGVDEGETPTIERKEKALFEF